MDKKAKITPRMLKRNDEPVTYAAMVAMPKFEGDARGGNFLFDDAHYHTTLFEKNDIEKISGHATQSQVTLKNGTRLYFGCDVKDLHEAMHLPAEISAANLIDLTSHSLFNAYKDKSLTAKEVCDLIQIHDPKAEEHPFQVKFATEQHQVACDMMYFETGPDSHHNGNRYRLNAEKTVRLRISEEEFSTLKKAAALMQVNKIDYSARIKASNAYFSAHKSMPKLGQTLEDKPAPAKKLVPPRPPRRGGSYHIM